MALRNGTYRLESGESWGVLGGERFGPLSPGDLQVVERGRPDMTIAGKDAELVALPAHPWYVLGERGVSAWVFAPWAPIDLVPPHERAAVLAADDVTRPSAAQWVAHVDHGQALPVQVPGSKSGNGAGDGSLLDWLRGTLDIAGKAVPRWAVGAVGLVVLYLVARR